MIRDPYCSKTTKIGRTESSCCIFVYHPSLGGKVIQHEKVLETGQKSCILLPSDPRVERFFPRKLIFLVKSWLPFRYQFVDTWDDHSLAFQRIFKLSIDDWGRSFRHHGFKRVESTRSQVLSAPEIFLPQDYEAELKE